jgi:hypothetical protein
VQVLENDNEEDDMDFEIDQEVAKKKGIRIATSKAKGPDDDAAEPGVF